GATALVAVLNHFSKGLPDVSRLRQYEPSETTRIYAANGDLLASLYKENRTWTPYEDISPYVIKAIVAVEDSRFYTHRGVDPVGVARAAFYDIRHQGAHQGASTITMQLARNLFLTPTQNMERKIREMLLALQIEKKFTKDEIIELYLNQIYFGSGAYGIQAASKTYFNKPCKDLTPAEAALLAGLPQAPSEYSPFVDERAAKLRQILVLGRMVDVGFLEWKEYREALTETRNFEFKRHKKKEFQVLKLPYFTSFVLKQLYERYDEDLLYRGGLKIYTTVEPDLQLKSEQIVHDMVAADSRAIHVDNAAMVCIENKTGFIRAMVGGTKWTEKNQFNRAWQARRQPGSSFKVFVYTTAIEAGYSPDTIIPDTEVTYRVSPTETWTPKNSDHGYLGPIPMWKALMLSRNVVAVKLLTMVGADRVIEYAYKMGIREKLHPHLSLALGAVEVSVLEMASAYSVLPNGGIRVQPTAIKKILDSNGIVIEDHTFPKQEEVLSETTAALMIEMMKRVVESGTGTKAQLPGREVAGKTGTTDDFRDAWFVGFTPEFTSAVWVGNDDNSKMWHSYGGDLPARIWSRCMAAALKGMPATRFGDVVEGKKGILMCNDSKRRANSRCPNTYKEYFAPGQIPDFCRMHGQDTTTNQLPAPPPSNVGDDDNLPTEAGSPEDAIPSGEDPLAIPQPTDPNWPGPPPDSLPSPNWDSDSDPLGQPQDPLSQPNDPLDNPPIPQEVPMPDSTPGKGTEL
ncbi:MAG: PBP1A family penicillin-binding protein, partial [Candidatus Eremiobacteraeota bacterium]|nr:PBP1A family penicillin-binding protein [Candidatus Eremiobacteraeota bacterium]